MQPSAHHSLGLSVSGCGSCASVSAAWGGWQHHPLIIFTFCTFLILFWGGQQYHLLIPFPIHLILFVVLYFLRPSTSFFISFYILTFLIFFLGGWQHPLFLYLDFYDLFWRRMAKSSFILFDVLLFFWGRQHAPLIILTLLSLLEEADDTLFYLLYFLILLLRSTKFHF